MSNDLQLFSNEEFGAVRVAEVEGEHYFALKDVLEAQGSKTTTTNAISAIEQGLGDGYVVGIPIKDSLGRDQEAKFISEPAVTFLVARSNTDRGRRCNRWIHTEILPTIRKHGGYLTPQKIEEVLSDPDTIIKLAMDLKEERARRIEAERTKAWIGSKREATAMATASSAVRKVTYLEDRLGEGKNWKQCKAIPWVLDYFAPSKGMWSVLGKKMAALSVDMGYEVRKIEDEKYGNLNAYHVNVWEEMHDRMESDRNMMSKYRKELAS